MSLKQECIKSGFIRFFKTTCLNLHVAKSHLQRLEKYFVSSFTYNVSTKTHTEVLTNLRVLVNLPNTKLAIRVTLES